MATTKNTMEKATTISVSDVASVGCSKWATSLLIASRTTTGLYVLNKFANTMNKIPSAVLSL